MSIALKLHSTSATGDAKDEVSNAKGAGGFDRRLVMKMMAKLDALSHAVGGLQEGQAELRRDMAVLAGADATTAQPRRGVGLASSAMASAAEVSSAMASAAD